MRYVIHESEGYLTPAKTRHRKTGLTVSVHDTLVNHRTVGLFRSEEMTKQGGHYSNEERKRRAREAARKLAEELNDG